MSRSRKIILVIVGVVLAAYVFVLVTFSVSKYRYTARLNAGSRVVETEGAEFITVEGGDHWIAISRPEDFIPELIAFLTRHVPNQGKQVTP